MCESVCVLFFIFKCLINLLISSTIFNFMTDVDVCALVFIWHRRSFFLLMIHSFNEMKVFCDCVRITIVSSSLHIKSKVKQANSVRLKKERLKKASQDISSDNWLFYWNRYAHNWIYYSQDNKFTLDQKRFFAHFSISSRSQCCCTLPFILLAYFYLFCSFSLCLDDL